MPSYPLATNGLNKQLFMELSGAGISNANPETPSGTLVGGNNTYKVTLSLANSVSANVSATALVQISLFDLAGNSESINGSIQVVAYQAPANAPIASGTNESYIGSKNANTDANGFVKQQNGYVAAVGAVTPSAQSLIVPAAVGQVVVEYRYPLGLNGPSSSGSTNPNLASLNTVAILAYSAITAAAATAVSGGDIDISPDGASSVTGPITLTGGNFHYADATAAQAQTDLTAAIAYYSGLAFTSLGTAVNLSTSGNGANASTYKAGNYSSTSSMDIPTSITLDAQGNPNAVFVFKAGSTLTLESGASVLLVNGAQAANVFWVVGSSFTSVWNGIISNIVGTIMATASITLGGGTLAGRALASTGAVTMAATEAITMPAPAVAPVAAASVVSSEFIYSQLLVQVIS